VAVKIKVGCYYSDLGALKCVQLCEKWRRSRSKCRKVDNEVFFEHRKFKMLIGYSGENMTSGYVMIF
jgi:hypothetical protein